MSDQQKLTVEVPRELHRAAKVKAAQEGRSLADVIRELLTGWAHGKPAEGNKPKRAARGE